MIKTRLGATTRGLSGAAALRGGGVTPSDTLDVRTDLRELAIEHRADATREGFPYQLDGDYLGEVSRLVFEHRPDAVRLAVPHASA